MFSDLLNQSVKSQFTGYNAQPIQTAVALVKRPNESKFCNPLVKPSRDLPAIQKVAQHNFEVEMKPVCVEGAQISGLAIACEKGTNKTLGRKTVTDGYKPLQPTELYDIADHILKLDASVQVTDIVTRSDRYMIGLQLNKGEWMPTGDFADRIQDNIILFTTFDGSKPTSLRTVSFRPFCSNQYAGTNHLFAIRHTSKSDERIALLKRLLSGVTREIEERNRAIQSLVNKAMTKGQATEWFSALLLDGKDRADLEGRGKTIHDNKLTDFQRLLTSGAGCEAGEGTAYATFNALTNYCTHERSTRVTGQNGSAQELRWESNLFGTSAEFAQRGFNQLVAR